MLKQCAVSSGLHSFPLFVFFLFGVLTGESSYPQEKDVNEPQNSRIDWLSGKQKRTASLLAISGDLHGSQLRPRLMQLARGQRTGIFVDRRVDPSIELDMKFEDQTLEQLLWHLAEKQGFGVCRVGDVFYLGPRTTSDSLPILLHALKLETTKLKRFPDGAKWHLKSELSWPELSEPRMLIGQLLSENGIELANPELVPHDLWPAAQLPKLALDIQLALLLVGFDLWFERSSDGRVKLVPFPETETGTCVITHVEDAGKIARSLRDKFGKKLEGRFSANGKTLKITGSTEVIQKARRWLVDYQRPITGSPSKHLYSIDTTAQRGSILATIAGQIDCKLSYPESAKSELTKTVRIKMDNQPVESIILEVLKGTALTHQIRGSQLVIK